jgi:hypothetical protein
MATQSQPGSNLHYLYVADSIVKNIRQPYIDLFSERLYELFKAVMAQVCP